MEVYDKRSYVVACISGWIFGSGYFKGHYSLGEKLFYGVVGAPIMALIAICVANLLVGGLLFLIFNTDGFLNEKLGLAAFGENENSMIFKRMALRVSEIVVFGLSIWACYAFYS